MDFDKFLQHWRAALRDSRLPAIGHERVHLEFSSLDREYEAFVEPFGGQPTKPFFVGAKLAWRWSALHSARGGMCEEDLLTEVLGRESVPKDTEQPWLRVDVELYALAPFDQPLPLPGRAAWREWATEATARLERIEPLLPDDVVEEQEDGRLAVLAWKGEPTAKVVCDSQGELRLAEVRLEAWVSVTLPREWDDPDRVPDDGPEGQLSSLFARLKASLRAWAEALDHLAPPAAP